MAHARRKFFEAVREERETAMAALGLLGALFRIEQEAADMPPAKRLDMRKTRSLPVWKELLAWCEQQMASRGKERSLLARAVRYLLRHQEALGRFLEDGRIKLTNNQSERQLRSVVVGRHNWLFVGSDEDAEASAVFISLIASCKLLKLDPEQYLRDIFRVLPQWPSDRLLELHPRYWPWTKTRLVAAELDIAYGDITIPKRVDPSDWPSFEHTGNDSDAETHRDSQ